MSCSFISRIVERVVESAEIGDRRPALSGPEERLLPDLDRLSAVAGHAEEPTSCSPVPPICEIEKRIFLRSSSPLIRPKSSAQVGRVLASAALADPEDRLLPQVAPARRSARQGAQRLLGAGTVVLREREDGLVLQVPDPWRCAGSSRARRRPAPTRPATARRPPAPAPRDPGRSGPTPAGSPRPLRRRPGRRGTPPCCRRQAEPASAGPAPSSESDGRARVHVDQRVHGRDLRVVVCHRRTGRRQVVIRRLGRLRRLRRLRGYRRPRRRRRLGELTAISVTLSAAWLSPCRASSPWIRDLERGGVALGGGLGEALALAPAERRAPRAAASARRPAR